MCVYVCVRVCMCISVIYLLATLCVYVCVRVCVRVCMCISVIHLLATRNVVR